MANPISVLRELSQMHEETDVPLLNLQDVVAKYNIAQNAPLERAKAQLGIRGDIAQQDMSAVMATAEGVEGAVPGPMAPLPPELAGAAGYGEGDDIGRRAAALSEAYRNRQRMGVGSDQMITDQYGRIVGAWNARHNRFTPFPQAPGIPTDPRRGGIPSGEQSRRGGLLGIVKQLGDLKKIAETNRSSIGLMEGRWTGFKRNTGWFGGTTPEQNDLFHIADSIRTTITYMFSGKQINESEAARLKSLVPNPNDPEAKFFDDMRRLEEEVRFTLESTTELDMSKLGGHPTFTGEDPQDPLGANRSPGSPDAAPGAPGGNAPVRVKRHPKTGQLAHSYDGVNWKLGPPPR